MEYPADYYFIPEKVLSADQQVRFCGVIDKLGHLVSKRLRVGIESPLMSLEENDRYALLTTMRRRPNLPWSKRLGRTYYFLLRSERLVQATIPISDDYLLLVYFDVEQDKNYDRAIIDTILPIIESIRPPA